MGGSHVTVACLCHNFITFPLIVLLFTSVCSPGVWVKGLEPSMACLDFWMTAVLVSVWQIFVGQLIMATNAQHTVECAELEFMRHLPICIHSVHSF